MRKIKFRAWDDHYKYMNYKVLVGVYGEWEEVKDDEDYTSCAMWIEPKNVDYKCEPHWTNFEPYHKDIKLMQYTGLKDKNGKEIYEGDIVYVLSEDETAFIMWYTESSRFVIQFNDWCSDFDSFYGKDLEVIGNIYDNPELLEIQN